MVKQSSKKKAWKHRKGATRRHVYVSKRTPNKGTTKLWAYGYADIAHLLGLEVEKVLGLVKYGKLKISTLEDLCAEFMKRRCVNDNPADFLGPVESLANNLPDSLVSSDSTVS